MVFSLNTLIREFWYTPTANLTYFANQKAGTTSVKRTLWRHHNAVTGQINDQYNEDFAILNRPADVFPDYRKVANDDLTAFKNSFFFSCVRNPYVRILSGYLDKIAPIKKSIARNEFCLHHNLDHNQKIEFSDFLGCISRSLPETIDVHFCPQTINLMIPHVPYNSIFHLENNGPLTAFLNSRGIQYSSQKNNATGSIGLLQEYYDDETIDLVKELYCCDFENFGYSTDIKKLDPITEINLDKITGDFLMTWMDLVGNKGKAARITKIRDEFPGQPYFIDFLHYQVFKTRNWKMALQSAKLMVEKEPRNWKYLFALRNDCTERGDLQSVAFFEDVIRKHLPGAENLLRTKFVPVSDSNRHLIY
jgi:hypothetical protein